MRLNSHLVSRNAIQIQCLPHDIQNKTFGIATDNPGDRTVEDARKLLESFALSVDNLPVLPSLVMQLPELVGGTLQKHFYYLGLEQAEPYLTICNAMILKSIPAAPLVWSTRAGWTRYTLGTDEPVDYPDGDCLVFDVEVLVKLGHHPIIATAVSTTAWFSWTSPSLNSDSPASLISFGPPDIARVVIGHNIGYDRARIREEFTLTPTRTAFIDTMSLHICISGMSSQQLPQWQAHAASKKKWIAAIGKVDSDAEMSAELQPEEWLNMTCRNSLQSVAALHLDKQLDKEQRSVFVTGDKGDVRERFQELMTYCAQDVITTSQVYNKLFPKFLIKCPHPLTFAGLLKLSKCFLPVNGEWAKFKDKANSTYDLEMTKIDAQLLEIADDACRDYGCDDAWKQDNWLRNLDWSVKEPKPEREPALPVKPSKKQSTISDKTLAHREAAVYKNASLNGKPQWYRDLWCADARKVVIKLGMRISPFLLRISYKNQPIMHSTTNGWFYAVPKTAFADKANTKIKNEPGEIEFVAEQDVKAKVKKKKGEKNKEPTTKFKTLYHHIASHDTASRFFKIPHQDGPNSNCGNPLGKSYTKDFDTGVFASTNPTALDILARNRRCSYWTSIRSRVESQFVYHDDQSPQNEMILPLVVPFGTVTRRVVEGTWMTLSNPKKDKIGSEVKSLIRAPPGFAFIGADVDSEELWIASLLGDAQFGIHGATPLGFMTLEGNKKSGTDLHSRTAEILGVSRNDAKVFNYARIYGAGVGYAAKILKQCSGELDDKKIDLIAKKLYAETKGKRMERKGLKVKKEEIKLTGSKPNHPWSGGSESFMFNTLESIVNHDTPRTPALGCIIPDGLMKQAMREKSPSFMTSRINWVVQSSGVDYLHLLIVSMNYLCRRLKIKAEFVISIHDEVRYLVKKEDQNMAAYALQISNLWTRAFFSKQVGIESLPLSVAFFSSVDIDHCLRKEVTLTCVTPSNETAVPSGISQTITETLATIKLTPGMFGKELQSIQDIRKRYPKPPTLYAFDKSAGDVDFGFIEHQIKTKT